MVGCLAAARRRHPKERQSEGRGRPTASSTTTETKWHRHGDTAGARARLERGDVQYPPEDRTSAETPQSEHVCRHARSATWLEIGFTNSRNSGLTLSVIAGASVALARRRRFSSRTVALHPHRARVRRCARALRHRHQLGRPPPQVRAARPTAPPSPPPLPHPLPPLPRCPCAPWPFLVAVSPIRHGSPPRSPLVSGFGADLVRPHRCHLCALTTATFNASTAVVTGDVS